MDHLRTGHRSPAAPFGQRSGEKLGSPLSGARLSTAFTLLEVLLAITIAGFVLAAASAMLVSVGDIWAERLESNFMEDHVDGVTEFLQSSFKKAGFEIALESPENPESSDSSEEGSGENNESESPISIAPSPANESSQSRSGNEASTSGLLRQSDNPIDFARPPGFADYTQPLINFKIRDQAPLFVNLEDAPVLGIDVFLHFEKDEGLSLLWYSILQEEIEDENDLRRTAISQFVVGLRYIYWDERFERWEEEEEPKEADTDQFVLPRFIKLIFEKDGITKERTISIPVPSRHLPLF